MSFLIDTDTCSAHMKGNARVTNRFLQYTGRLYLSVVGLGELYTWISRAHAPPNRRRKLNTLLKDVNLLEVNADIAQHFGEIRAALMDRGLPVPGLDLFHAATALHHGLTMVTHNTADFANIPDLTVVDWMTP